MTSCQICGHWTPWDKLASDSQCDKLEVRTGNNHEDIQQGGEISLRERTREGKFERKFKEITSVLFAEGQVAVLAFSFCFNKEGPPRI